MYRAVKTLALFWLATDNLTSLRAFPLDEIYRRSFRKIEQDRRHCSTVVSGCLSNKTSQSILLQSRQFSVPVHLINGINFEQLNHIYHAVI